jgi:hypothetical protein
MKRYFAGILALILLNTFIFQGCSLPDKLYLKKDTIIATPLKVIRYETPDIRRYSVVEIVIVAAVGFGLLGGIGAPVCALIYHDMKKLPDDQGIPDFGKLVMTQFIDRAKNEIPNWPVMIVEEKPIQESPTDNANYILEFKADPLEIKSSLGLRFTTIVTMKDKEGNVVWEKGYKYSSEEFNRKASYEQLKNYNYKLLKEEMSFAADKTVTDFIENFKKPQPFAQK